MERCGTEHAVGVVQVSAPDYVRATVRYCALSLKELPQALHAHETVFTAAAVLLPGYSAAHGEVLRRGEKFASMIPVYYSRLCGITPHYLYHITIVLANNTYLPVKKLQ